MKFKIKAYNLQELGQRTNQEDSLFPALGKSTSDDRLFVLCDGMGGHEKGEVASATVCATLSRVILSAWHPGEVLSDELFLQALSAAYDALDAKDNGEERKMGTTLTFLCLHASGATVAHIAIAVYISCVRLQKTLRHVSSSARKTTRSSTIW